MELLDVDSPVSELLDIERQISDEVFRLVVENDDDVKLPDELKQRILDLLRNIREHSSASQSRGEYKWCIDTSEKWRFFLVSNGEYVPFQRLPKPDFLSGNLKSLKHSKSSTLRTETSGRTISGVAVRDSFDKTAKIKVTRRKRDSLTGKTVRRTKQYLVHDEFNKVSEGDYVVAIECRPVSRNKRYTLLRHADRNP